MFSMCSELTPRARIPDTRIPQLMQPCVLHVSCVLHVIREFSVSLLSILSLLSLELLDLLKI